MNNSLSISAAAVTSLAIILAYRLRQNRQHEVNLHAVTPAPTEAALKVAKELTYTPDHLPGGRTIPTPFGKTRVFEFGPENGPKVLLIHGISTPCLSLAELAHLLVAKGCRVMTFDLYGRGFSDNPTYHAHSSQLFISQTLCVLASSSLSWTGDNAFSLIGYSMGGAIAANFADCFPHMVNSLVLLCPAGLIREHNLAWQRYLMFQLDGLLPTSLLRTIILRRLKDPPPMALSDDADKTHLTDPIAKEIGEAPIANTAAVKPVFDAVRWQAAHHYGFIPAFTSSVRHAPLTGQHQAWGRIGQRLNRQRSSPDDKEAQRNGFIGGKLIAFYGEDDAIVLTNEVRPDAIAAVGEANMEIINYKTGHDLPIVLAKPLASKIWEIWQKLGVVH